MKPGSKGIEAIKEAIIADVPRHKLDDKSWSLEDWVMDQLQSSKWIFFNPEKAKDINCMYRLRKEILERFS